MKVLIVCEFSGTVRDAFSALGHDATSCDLLPSETPGKHLQCDARDLDLSIYNFIGAHQPCTFLCNSGVRWLYNFDGTKNTQRWKDLQDAVEFFNYLKASIHKGYVENPIPHFYAREGFVHEGCYTKGIGHYTQRIQPWMFGHGETKATCLWLKNLLPLAPTEVVSGRSPRVHHMSPGKDRWKQRSVTLPGIAKAMAQQWGGNITNDMP